MLIRLAIRNIALIAEEELILKEGFTTLTGETGAGKSILMDALSLALGARSDSGLIRHGAGSASIEATFDLSSRPDICSFLEEHALMGDIENEVTFRRFITPEKSRSFINGMQVNLTQMKHLGDRLVDIHGQNDHQQLLNDTRHAALLDHFGGLTKERETVKNSYKKWKENALKLSELASIALKQETEKELLDAYIEELTVLDPKEGEEEKLSQERQRLMSGEEAVKNLSTALSLMSGEVDLSGRLGQAESLLSRISHIPEIETLYERLANTSHELIDICREIEILGQALDPSPERLAEVDERLFALKDIARKHQTTTDQLSQTLEDLIEKRSKIENINAEIEALEDETYAARLHFEEMCALLSSKREKASQKLSKSLDAVLKHLEMGQAVFKAERTELHKEKWNENGSEKITFMVATNLGSPLKPLVKVASGGEVSRLMLALKHVFYAPMRPTTLIFDEVDTGVSGYVAEAMGDVMKTLSEKHQIFSITHLPQVAAKGQHHFKIEKFTEEKETFTTLRLIKGETRMLEIARMMAGKEITPEAQAAAQKLLKNTHADF